MAEAYTIPIEINEEVLLHSDPEPAPVPAVIQATLDVSLAKWERGMKGKQGTFKQTFAKQLKTSHHLTQYKIFNAYPRSSSSRPL